MHTALSLVHHNNTVQYAGRHHLCDAGTGYTQHNKDFGSLPENGIEKALGGCKTPDVEDPGNQVRDALQRIFVMRRPVWRRLRVRKLNHNCPP